MSYLLTRQPKYSIIQLATRTFANKLSSGINTITSRDMLFEFKFFQIQFSPIDLYDDMFYIQNIFELAINSNEWIENRVCTLIVQCLQIAPIVHDHSRRHISKNCHNIFYLLQLWSHVDSLKESHKRVSYEVNHSVLITGFNDAHHWFIAYKENEAGS